jgi:beta-N-acetylhexosaminidase
LTAAVAQGQLNKADLELSRQRILEIKKLKLLQPDPRPLDEAMQVIGCAEHLYLADCIAKGVIPQGILDE